MDPQSLARRILAANDDVATRLELSAAGVPHRWLRHQLADDKLVELFPGVIATPQATSFGHRLLAALAFGGRDARSHATAAEMFDLVPHDDTIHLVVPHGTKRPPARGLVVRQKRHRDRAWVAGLPVVPPAQTTADLLDTASVDDVRFVAAEAVRRGQACAADLQGSRSSPSHATAWRDVVEEIAAGAISGGEARYWRAVRDSGLPLPILNAAVTAAGRRHYVDALWKAYALGVEIDGYRYHSSRAAFDADRVRQNAILLANVVLLRFSVERVLTDPEGCVDVTRRALQVRASELRLPRHLRRRLA